MPNHRKSRGKYKILFYVDDDIFEHIKNLPYGTNMTEFINDILRYHFFMYNFLPTEDKKNEY